MVGGTNREGEQQEAGQQKRRATTNQQNDGIYSTGEVGGQQQEVDLQVQESEHGTEMNFIGIDGYGRGTHRTWRYARRAPFFDETRGRRLWSYR